MARCALALALAILPAAVLTGCARATEGGARVVFVGPVDGTDARVAFVLARGVLEAYVCSGPTSLGYASGWFRAEALVPDAEVALRDDAGAALRFRAPAGGEPELRGTLALPDGRAFAWVARRDAGADLLDDATDGCRSGVVLWSDGAERRAQGVYCDGAGFTAQVTPLRPWKWRGGDELRVRAQGPAGELLRWVRRVLPER